MKRTKFPPIPQQKTYNGPFPLQDDKTFIDLNPKQQKFIYNKFLQPSSNWTDALCYCDAYNIDHTSKKKLDYAWVRASVLIRKNKIAYCMGILKSAYRESLGVTAERVLKEESRLAFSDFGEFLDNEGYLICNPSELPEDCRRAIASFKKKTWYDIKGNPQVKYSFTLWNKGQSLGRIQSMLGMNAPQKVNVQGDMKHNHAGSVDVNLNVKPDLSALNKKELKLLDGLLGKIGVVEKDEEE